MPATCCEVSMSTCPECRGEAHFVLFPRNTRVKSRVTCPACQGTGMVATEMIDEEPSTTSTAITGEVWNSHLQTTHSTPVHARNASWPVEV